MVERYKIIEELVLTFLGECGSDDYRVSEGYIVLDREKKTVYWEYRGALTETIMTIPWIESNYIAQRKVLHEV